MKNQVLRQIAFGSALGFIIGWLVGYRLGIFAGLASGFISGVLLCGIQESVAVFRAACGALSQVCESVQRVTHVSVRDTAEKVLVRTHNSTRGIMACAATLLWAIIAMTIIMWLGSRERAAGVLNWRAIILTGPFMLSVFSIIGIVLLMIYLERFGKLLGITVLPLNWWLVEKMGDKGYTDDITPFLAPVWEELIPDRIARGAGVRLRELCRLLFWVIAWGALIPLVGIVLLALVCSLLILDALATVALGLAVSKKIAAGFGAVSGLALDWMLFPVFGGGVADWLRLSAMTGVSAQIGVGLYLLREKLCAIEVAEYGNS